MALGEAERRFLERMERISKETALESGWGTPEDRRWVIETANAWRRANGIGPLGDDDDYPSELGFYERARALGMLERRRSDA